MQMFTDTMCKETKQTSLHQTSKAYIYYFFKTKNCGKDY